MPKYFFFKDFTLAADSKGLPFFFFFFLNSPLPTSKALSFSQPPLTPQWQVG